MQGRYQYRPRVYSESQDPSPERQTSRPHNHIRYIGKFPIALPPPTYEAIVQKRVSRDYSDASNSKGRKSSTEMKRPNRLVQDNYDIDSAQVSVAIQKPEKGSIEPKRSKIQHKLIEKYYLPEIDKIGTNTEEQNSKRAFSKEGYGAGNSKMLQKVHKLFCNYFHNQSKEILKPEAQLPRGAAKANTSSNSKYRRACFFDNLPLPQPPPIFQPITSVNRVHEHQHLKTEIKSVQNTVEVTPKKYTDNKKKGEVPSTLDPLDPEYPSSNYCRKPLTHQDRKRHKTIENKESHPIELFTFYPSKKRIETQVVDNEFL